MPTPLRSARPGLPGALSRLASLAPWRRAGRALLLLLALAGVAAAPAGCSRGNKRPATAAEPTEPITVTVENRHGTDMVIYVQRGNTRTRLGSVTPGSTQTFTLPVVFSGDIGGFYLIGDPIGERTGITSERVVAQGGQRIVWSLEARLAQSSLGIY